MSKSWGEKLANAKPYEIKPLDRAFADLPAGCQMLIPSPPIIDGYIRAIPRGQAIDVGQMRDDLAKQFGAFELGRTRGSPECEAFICPSTWKHRRCMRVLEPLTQVLGRARGSCKCANA